MSEDGKDIVFNKAMGQGGLPFTANIVSSKDVEVGGAEGPKRKIVIEKNRHGKDQPAHATFFSKETDYGTEEMEKVIKSYAFLREHGFPVPNTTRYFSKDNKVHILMTDMADENYLVWGYSNNMTEQQRKDLIQMDLQQEDYDLISTEAQKYANLASDLGVDLEAHYYHTRQNIQTKKVELIFLDINPDIFNKFNYEKFSQHNQFSSKSLKNHNLRMANGFVKSLSFEAQEQ